MKKSCVLVSGGAGYIGSHTAVELIGAGYDVVIVDNLSNSDMNAVEGVRRITGVEVPFEKADCCDRDAFRKVFEKYDFDSVIHFAASKAVGESVSKPLEYYRNNLMSFMNVIGLMREYGRQNIVFSSSCTVYGEADVLPVLVADAPVLLTLNILIAVLLIISIFLYRDLRRQMRVTLLILLLICASMVTSGFIIYAGIPGAEPILLGGVSLLLLALIFALLAYRAMGRDRRLLAAADRLR